MLRDARRIKGERRDGSAAEKEATRRPALDISLRDCRNRGLLQQLIARATDGRPRDIQIANPRFGLRRIHGRHIPYLDRLRQSIFLRAEPRATLRDLRRGRVERIKRRRRTRLCRQVYRVHAQRRRRRFGKVNRQGAGRVQSNGWSRAIQQLQIVKARASSGLVYLLNELLRFLIQQGALRIGERSGRSLYRQFANTAHRVLLRSERRFCRLNCVDTRLETLGLLIELADLGTKTLGNRQSGSICRRPVDT